MRVSQAGIAALTAWGVCGNITAAQCGGGTWTQLPNMAARTGATMVYDSARQRLVLFGGSLAGGSLSSGTLEFIGGAWQSVTTAGISPRTGHAMAFDASRGVTVLFGGSVGTSLSSATFEYDGAWHAISTTGPSARQGHAMAYDPDRHVIMLHGGRTSVGVANDTWEYAGGVWTRRELDGVPRWVHGLCFDPAAHRMLLVAGQTTATANPTYAQGTWAWNGGTWLQVAAGPTEHARFSLAYVPSRQRVVMFGGHDADATFSDLQEFDGTAWTPITLPAGPGVRQSAAMAYDAANAKLALAGGTSGSAILTDAWTLALGTGGLAFTTLPQGQSLTTGQTATFQAAVSGAASQWRWRRDGVPMTNGGRISGAFTATLTITGVTPADAAMFEVDVTGTCGTLRSPAVALSVLDPCGTADYNGDGDTGTDGDIEAFFRCLAGNCCTLCFSSDFNGDGDIGTDGDIEAFFRVLAGGPC